MSESVIENILKQISQLPPDQQRELRRVIEQQAQPMKSMLDNFGSPQARGSNNLLLLLLLIVATYSLFYHNSLLINRLSASSTLAQM